MKIISAELETVCGLTSDLPKTRLPEIAFCGRSNVGKSSLINCVLGRKSLARTSSQPGKTQTINYYNVNNAFYLVDLPGYGYTKASPEVSKKWGVMIENYIRESENLSYIFLLVDMRHEPSKLDVSMMETIRVLGYQPVVIATKADKLSRNERAKAASVIKKTLSFGKEEGEILLPFSSLSKEGRDDILDLFGQVV